jgi:hypothetical protein
MAYMVPLKRRCETDDCPRFAEYKVFINYSTFGIHCRYHAEELVARVNAEREESRRRIIAQHGG